MWDWFIQFLTSVLAQLASFLGDWGLAIIVLTFIIRLILTPLTVKSTRSSAKMQALQPRMKEIQERYADDPAKQQEEMQNFYAENKFNPLGGCLPVLLQMPIFFALFSVLKAVPSEAHFYNILSSLSFSPAESLASLGISGAIVPILLDILFGVLTLIPMLLQNQATSDPAQVKQTRIMGAVMAVMMVYFGWGVPVGVVLYYDTSAAFGVVQQKFVTTKVLEKAKAEEEERAKNAPIQVDVVRKDKKPRPHKKG